MKIKKLDIHSFGKFNNFNIDLSRDITFIYGENEAGKSTIFEALKSSISGFSNVKNYPYIPIDGSEAFISCEFDQFAVDRRLSKTAIGYLYSNGMTTRINNNPIYEMNRDIIHDIYTIDSDDILEISEKSVDSIIDSILYDSNFKKYNSLIDISLSIEKRRKAIYSKRSNSSKLINTIDSKILDIEDTIFDYKKKEREYNEKRIRLETELKTVEGSSKKKRQSIDIVKRKQSDLSISMEKVNDRLAEYGDYIKDNSSCMDLSYNLYIPVLFVLGAILFIVLSRPYFSLLSILAYLVYKFAYFSKAIKLKKILMLGRKRFMEIKSLQQELYLMKERVHALIIEENKLYENVDDGYEGSIIFELNKLKEEIINFHRLHDIEMLKQRLKNLQTEREALVLEYNRYLTLESLFNYSKSKYRSSSFIKILNSASNYLQYFTDGEYSEILKSDHGYVIKGGLNFSKGEGHLSRATKSQLYLSLRLAFADFFDNGDSKPMFFDDAFVHFDKSRLKSTIEFLKEYSKSRQLIIFSSKKYDGVEVSYEEIKKSETTNYS